MENQRDAQAEKERDQLKLERDRLRKALNAIMAVGHDDDCLFCGLKDKRAAYALKEVEEE